MLSESGANKINLFHELAKQFWGNNVRMLDVRNLEAPFDMFEIQMLLYELFEVLLEYDRSIVAISIKTNNDFVNMRKLTKDKTIKGFNSSARDGILHNFEILDKILRTMN